MTQFLKFGGAALALLAALIFSREYEKYLSEKLALCLGFSALLGHIRREVDCFLTSPRELLSGFQNTALEKSGYLALAKKTGISGAYFELEKKLSLPSEAKRTLYSFFGSFGREYREGTLKLIENTSSSIDKISAELKLQKDKEIKVFRTLAAALALGLVILLI